MLSQYDNKKKKTQFFSLRRIIDCHHIVQKIIFPLIRSFRFKIIMSSNVFLSAVFFVLIFVTTQKNI